MPPARHLLLVHGQRSNKHLQYRQAPAKGLVLVQSFKPVSLGLSNHVLEIFVDRQPEAAAATAGALMTSRSGLVKKEDANAGQLTTWSTLPIISRLALQLHARRQTSGCRPWVGQQNLFSGASALSLIPIWRVQKLSGGPVSCRASQPKLHGSHARQQALVHASPDTSL